MPQYLGEETMCGVFVMYYCAATKSTKNSFFSFVEEVITEMTYCGLLNEMLNLSSSRWSRSETFMQILAERVVNNLSFKTPVAVFV